MAVVVSGSPQNFEFEMELGWVAYDLPPIILTISEVGGPFAPTTLTVNVLNGPEEGDVTFKIGGTTVAVIEADAEGAITGATISVPDGLAAGTYTLTASAPSLGDGTADFTLPQDSPVLPDEPGAPVPPVIDPDARKWQFQDPVAGGLGTWTMPISPTMRTPMRVRKNLSPAHTTNYSGGMVHVFEGHTPPTDFRIGGYCPSKEFYDSLKAFMELNRRIYLIDERRDAWLVVPVGLDFEARRRQNYEGVFTDWSGNYTAHFLLLDQRPVEP